MMTENEAIKYLTSGCLDLACEWHIKGRCKDSYEVRGKRRDDAINTAINALEEIQQYRAIGTVEELKQLKENGSFTALELAQIAIGQMKLKEYQAIGTPEECREAVEKQRAKKPHKNFEKFSGVWCSCGKYLGKGYFVDKPNYCSDCGQKLDWSVEE